MSNTANLNIGETIVVFLGVQFAGYAISESIDRLMIDEGYKLIIVWAVAIIILIPVAFIKKRKNRLAEKQLNDLAIKIAAEVINKRKKLQQQEIEMKNKDELVNLLSR
jgi:hypothetical protein